MAYQLSLQKIEHCLSATSLWLTNNLLQLNQDKTEVILFRPRHGAQKITSIDVPVGNTVITSVPAVFRNLGVTLDSLMKMEQQVTSVYRSTYYQIRRIGKAQIGRLQCVQNTANIKIQPHNTSTERSALASDRTPNTV